jgi:hypothetical protein
MVKEQLLAERDPPPPSVVCEQLFCVSSTLASLLLPAEKQKKFLQVYPDSFRYSDLADPGASVLGEGGKTPSYATTIYKQQPLDHLWTIKVNGRTPKQYLLPQNEEKAKTQQGTLQQTPQTSFVLIKLEGPNCSEVRENFLFRGVLWCGLVFRCAPLTLVRIFVLQ